MLSGTKNSEKEITREYELSVLLAVGESMDAVKSVLLANGAAALQSHSISEIRLAYPIKKKSTALFSFCSFTAQPAQIEKMKAELRALKPVLRFLVITPPAQAVVQPAKAAPKATETKPEKPQPAILSNEALEQKLEEILK